MTHSSPRQVPFVGATEAEDPTEEPPVRERAVGSSSTFIFLVSVLIQGLGVVASVSLTKTVGAGGPGASEALVLSIVAFLLLIASSINQIGDFRIGSAFTYFLSRGQPIRQSAWTYFLLRIGMVGVGGVVLLALSPLLPYHDTTDYYLVFAVWMTFPVIWSVATVYQQLWVGRGDSIRAQGPLVVESAVRTAGLLAVAFTASSHNFTWVLWAMTVAYLAGAAASAAYCIPGLIRFRSPFRRLEVRRMFRFAWPLGGSLVLLFLSSNLTPLVISGAYPGLLYGFGLANGFRILILSLPAAVAVPLFPHLVRLHRSQEYEAVRAQTWRALRYTAMAVIPGVVALVVYRVNFINILFTGSWVSTTATPLAILAVAAIPAALALIIGTALNAIGQQRLELYLTSVQLGVLVVGLVLFLPPVNILNLSSNQGLIGPAIAILLSAIAGFGVSGYFLERLLAIRIQLRSIGLITLSAVASFVVVSRLNSVVDVNRFYILIGAIALGFLAYALTLAITGELAKADLDQIAASFGIPRRVAKAFSVVCWRASPIEVNEAPEGSASGLKPGASPWDREEAEAGPPLRSAPEPPAGAPREPEERGKAP